MADYQSRGALLFSRRGRIVLDYTNGSERTIDCKSTKAAWRVFSGLMLDIVDIVSIAGYRPHRGLHRKIFRGRDTIHQTETFYILESEYEEIERFYVCADKREFFNERTIVRGA